jgi:hypothetical protein
LFIAVRSNEQSADLSAEASAQAENPRAQADHPFTY